MAIDNTTTTVSDSLEELLLQSASSLRLSNLTPETISSTQSIDYLSHLSSLPLSSLIVEPDRLNSHAKDLETDLSLLCFREFKTFLLAHDSSISIRDAFRNLNQLLECFLDDTSHLDSLTSNFGEAVETILTDRNQLRVVLDHVGLLEDLIELPQLVSTSISARLWNEAIELALKVRGLDTRISRASNSSNQILSRIRIEIDQSLESLRDSCLIGLRDSGLKLPLAVRAIGVLRKMSSLFSSLDRSGFLRDALSESELRMAFLCSRWHALKGSLNQLQLSFGLSSTSSTIKTSAATSTTTTSSSVNRFESFSESAQQLSGERLKFLRRWIEVWREFVGDSVSMYLEIFLGQILSPSPSELIQKQQLLEEDIRSYPAQFLDDPQLPFIIFINQTLNLLISNIEHHLKSIVSVSSLASLMTQLTYCGTAFGRWGIDFTTRIGPMIVGRVEEVVKLRMRIGLDQLSSDLRPILSISPNPSSTLNRSGFQIRRRSLHPPPSTQTELENTLIGPDSIKQVLRLDPKDLKETVDKNGSSNDHLIKLLSAWLSLFPPIARFVNSQLVALNELRLLPSRTSFPPLSIYQAEILRLASEEIRRTLLSIPQVSSPTDSRGQQKKEEGNVDSEEMSKDDSEAENVDGLESMTQNQRARSIGRRALLVWTRNVIPALESSLRIGVYGELEIEDRHEALDRVIEDCEGLIRSLAW
ncbi:Dor1-like family-domain-containing protein [Phakopsora pachyrhizi]|nr:Dor1-like family-domain-containing protein [Phakopsora pachyrhizi]